MSKNERLSISYSKIAPIPFSLEFRFEEEVGGLQIAPIPFSLEFRFEEEVGGLQ